MIRLQNRLGTEVKLSVMLFCDNLVSQFRNPFLSIDLEGFLAKQLGTATISAKRALNIARFVTVLHVHNIERSSLSAHP